MTSSVPILYHDEIVDRLKKIFDLSTDTQLARYLDITKQSLNNFTSRSGLDINNKIISHLLAKLSI